MGKVFITKYPMAVNNDGLEILGCLRFKFKKSAKNVQAFRNVIVNYANGQTGTAKVTSGNAYFTDNSMSNNLGKSMNIKYNENAITLSNEDCNVDFSNKYNIVGISHWHFTEDTRIPADVYIDLASLKVLTNLTSLFLSSFYVTGDLSDITNLTNLTGLALGGTSVTGKLSDIANLTNLTSLNLRVTTITGVIGSLKNLTKLTTIVLDSTAVAGDITDIIDSLTNLKQLSIPSSVKITDAQKQTLTSRGCTVEVY